MLLLAVNFHYVAERPAERPRAIFPVTTGDLARCLEELGRAFEFVSRDDVVGAVERGAPLPARACLVTFDDGLRVQAELALPVLERLAVPGLFFVPARPLVEPCVLQVHKLHRLRERLSDDELESAIRSDLGDDALDSIDPDAAASAYRYDTPAAARVKYLLNRALAPEERERFVDAAFEQACGPEPAVARELYMSREQVRELEREHRAVGAHGYSHRALAPLGSDAGLDDLRRARDVLADVTGIAPRTVGYPHGTRETVDEGVAAAAARAGYVVGFTMERALNRSLDAPLLLARVDANDVPGGKRPLFELVGDEVVVGDGMSDRRRAYVLEAA